MTTLHITNGDSVAGTLNELSTDAVLPWRDVLHDGPVPGGIDAQALRKVRAEFLSDRDWTTYDVVLADLTGRDAQLAAMGAGDEVVLWFEPDLYDQLQLMQILSQLYLKPAAARPTVTIVSADELLGPLSKAELANYIEKQRVVRDVDLEVAAQGWEAFTSSDHTLLKQFAETEHALFAANSYAEDASVVLPHMHDAIRRLLQEYPSDKNGLSRSEQQIVDVLTQGARTIADTYQQSHGPTEEWIWLGDWGFAWYVERLMTGASPLIELVDGARNSAGFASRAKTDGAAFWNQKIQLTETGTAVAEGTRNALLLNGIDRWIGGVHLLQRAVS